MALTMMSKHSASAVVRSAFAPPHRRIKFGELGSNVGSAAARALVILENVAKSDVPVSTAELSAKLGLPNPTVHRLLILLEEMGFLQRELGGRRFIAGHRQIAMSIEALLNTPMKAEWRALLRRLVDDVRETCNLTVLVGGEVVYLDRIECDWPLDIKLQPGSHIPINGASGKVFWSFMPAAKRRQLLKCTRLTRFTERTIVDPDELEEELRKTRARKIGIDDGEIVDDFIGIAVPVFDARARVCATVSMHVPRSRSSVQVALSRIPALRRTAESISCMLPGRQSSGEAMPNGVVPICGGEFKACSGDISAPELAIQSAAK